MYILLTLMKLLRPKFLPRILPLPILRLPVLQLLVLFLIPILQVFRHLLLPIQALPPPHQAIHQRCNSHNQRCCFPAPQSSQAQRYTAYPHLVRQQLFGLSVCFFVISSFIFLSLKTKSMFHLSYKKIQPPL